MVKLGFRKVEKFLGFVVVVVLRVLLDFFFRFGFTISMRDISVIRSIIRTFLYFLVFCFGLLFLGLVVSRLGG